MKTALKRRTISLAGLVLLAATTSCVVPVAGEYDGGYYEPGGVVEYGVWGHGYHVAPPRGGERRVEHSGGPHTYRPAPQGHPTPSIPGHHRGN